MTENQSTAKRTRKKLLKCFPETKGIFYVKFILKDDQHATSSRPNCAPPSFPSDGKLPLSDVERSSQQPRQKIPSERWENSSCAATFLVVLLIIFSLNIVEGNKTRQRSENFRFLCCCFPPSPDRGLFCCCCFIFPNFFIVVLLCFLFTSSLRHNKKCELKNLRLASSSSCKRH